MVVRLATLADLSAIVHLATALWPEDARWHRGHFRALLAGKPASTLPLVVFVAEMKEAAVGFIEVGLRSHAEGCDGRRAAGFIEGWYVTPQARRRGVGRALVRAGEAWAVSVGATEMGSDTWSWNRASQRAHEALGYAVADRLIAFYKRLRPRKPRARG